MTLRRQRERIQRLTSRISRGLRDAQPLCTDERG
jgi:hypothetical protein